MQTSKFILATTALLWGLSASAAETATSRPTVGDIGALQAETLLLQAKAKREEASNSLKGAKVSAGAEQADIALPEVKSIFATSTKTSVRLVYASGAKIDAAVGDTVAGGYKIVSVDGTSQQVTLSKGGKTFLIGMGTGGSAKGASSITAPQVNPAVGMPGMSSSTIRR